MLNKEWKNFKSGSDVRGVALEGVEGMPITLTDAVTEAIAAAFGLWMTEKTGKFAHQLKISVGHDSRISGPRMKAAVLRALTKSGFTCFDCSLMSTPAMFMTCISKELDCDGAIQLTASHHPFNRNGLKFFTKEGGLEGDDITTLLEYAQDAKAAPVSSGGNIIAYDFLSVYAAGLVEKVRASVNSKSNYNEPLKGFKIIEDAGNGAGGFYAEKVLIPLGADTTGSQFLEPDGAFPNHTPNPENEEAMQAIMSAVIKNKADIGLIFDTDVDRAGAVDSVGTEINRNRLIALISAILLEEKQGATIVTDSITSSGLKKFIEAKGGIHHRFRRGYKNVINEAIRLNSIGVDCPIAIETSGHAALRENYFLDDGAYLVTKLLIKMAQLKEQGKKLDDMLIGLGEPEESKEFRMNILLEDFKPYGQKIIDELTAFGEATQGWEIAPDNHEGIRFSFGKGEGDGWFLLRLSLHDPLMPLNIESDSAGGVKIIAYKLYAFLNKYDKLDLTPLTSYLK